MNNPTKKFIAIEARNNDTLLTYQSYVVRWESRYGKFSADVKPEIEVFTNESDAGKFVKKLNDAFKLIKHTSGTRVIVEENENISVIE